MPPTKLQRIANDMRARVDAAKHSAIAWEKRDLPRGLEVLLSLDCVDGRSRYRLALRREKVSPADIEVQICARAFGVPEETPWQRRSTKEPNLRSGRVVKYQIVELFWFEDRLPLWAQTDPAAQPSLLSRHAYEAGL